MADFVPFEDFGHYTLLHRLAVSGMSEVFLAQPKDADATQPTVVVKRMKAEGMRDPELVKMFVDEDSLLARMRHPSIIRALDFGKAQDRYYLVLEHVWGESLTTLCKLCLKRGVGFPLGIALHTAAEVADALAHAHTRRDAAGELSPIIHRDVTLNNVMLTYDGQVKVLDFGLAKASGRLSHTRVGEVKGTLTYIAPEQFTTGTTTTLTDIYQLGVLLYKIAVGREPTHGKGELGLIQAIMKGEIIKPGVAVPNFPVSVEDVLLTALHRHPARRYQSAAMMKQALQELIPRRLGDGTVAIANFLHQVAGDRHAQQRALVDRLLRRELTEADSELLRRSTRDEEPATIRVAIPAEIATSEPSAALVVADEIPFVSDVRLIQSGRRAAPVAGHGAGEEVTELSDAVDDDVAMTTPERPDPLRHATAAVSRLRSTMAQLTAVLAALARRWIHTTQSAGKAGVDQVRRLMQRLAPGAQALAQRGQAALRGPRRWLYLGSGAAIVLILFIYFVSGSDPNAADVAHAQTNEALRANTAPDAGPVVEPEIAALPLAANTEISATTNEPAAPLLEPVAARASERPGASSAASAPDSTHRTELTRKKRRERRQRIRPEVAPAEPQAPAPPPATTADAPAPTVELDAKPTADLATALDLAQSGDHAAALATIDNAVAQGKHSAKTLDYVIERLKSPQAARAQQLLARWPHQSVERRLVKLVETRSWAVRYRALDVLAQRNALKLVDAQALAIRDLQRGPTCELRRQALELLGEVGDKPPALDAIHAAKSRQPDNLCMVLNLTVVEGKVRRRLGM